MLKKILIVVGVIVAILVSIVASRPADFLVERSLIVAAPAETLFEEVNDLHRWQAWSPWVKLDPNAKNSFTGPKAGEGASMSWVGNSDVGVGSMTIVESRRPDYIRFRLDFLKPMQATNTSEFYFEPEGDQIRVTWMMSGTNNFIGKAFGLILDCDKMVGDQFEKGLAQLKIIAEAKK